MQLQLKRVEEPFVFELTNADGVNSFIDASAAIGGKGRGLRPMEYLAGSLASCISIDVLLILQKKRGTVKHYEVQVNGQRKTGVSKEFERIELTFLVETDLTATVVQDTVHLVHEKYCSVAKSLHPEIEIAFTIQKI